MGKSFDPLPSGQIMIFPGWWYTYPSEKHESQLGLLLPIYGKHIFQTTSFTNMNLAAVWGWFPL